jgi:hypothetical protein
MGIGRVPASSPTQVSGAKATISPMRAGAEPRTTLAERDGERVVPAPSEELGARVEPLEQRGYGAAHAIWNEAGFGQLKYPETRRIVIPEATLIACGTQTPFSALFLSVLGLRRR